MAGQHPAASTHHIEIGEKVILEQGLRAFSLKKKKKKPAISILAGLRKVDVLLVTPDFTGM